MTTETTEAKVSVQKHETKITDEMIANLKSRIGKEICKSVDELGFIGAEFRSNDIRHFCKGIGDFNPLFADPDYATKTSYGKQVMPPGAILEMEQLDPEHEGLRGCRAILEASCLEWNSPILMGDSLRGKTIVTAVRSVPGLDRVIVQDYETVISNQKGETVGTVTNSWRSYERGSAMELMLYGRREPASYTREQIDEILQEYKREEEKNLIRGATPRNGESVQVGEDIPYIVKGPTTRTQRATLWPDTGFSGGRIVKWYHGMGEGLEQYEKYPELFVLNENGAPEPAESVEWLHERAQSLLGVPGSLEMESERLHWTIQLLTNWQGDGGFLRKLDLKFPNINLMGDLTRCYGKVKSKSSDNGKHVVEIDLWNANQTGDTVTVGTAEIILP